MKYCFASCKGCIELDELNFNKITNKFAVSIIKFDVAFPYGEKHEAFAEFSKEIGKLNNVDDLLIGVVGIKDYGEKDNSMFLKKFNIIESKLPVFKLFNSNNSEIVTYSDGKHKGSM